MHRPIEETHHQCHICDKFFATKLKLRDHLEQHTDGRPVEYTCKFCKQTFERRASMVYHRKRCKNSISENGQYECKECNETFLSVKLHRQHDEEKHHSKSNSKKSNKTKTTQPNKTKITQKQLANTIKYQCQSCVEHFTTKKAFIKHKKMHAKLEQEILELEKANKELKEKYERIAVGKHGQLKSEDSASDSY